MLIGQGVENLMKNLIKSLMKIFFTPTVFLCFIGGRLGPRDLEKFISLFILLFINFFPGIN